ncbi:hypothetical protein [Sediminibacterium sp.]|uniref:hypothetical protein n=1 Tax=Sediminibacterium sp. TaxID=1917865 RepID=UPI003F6EDDAC
MKKQRLLNKIAVDEQSSFLVTWWLGIANLINRTGYKWELEYLDVVTENQWQYWIDKLAQEPWSNFSFSNTIILKGELYWVHEMLYLKYPSTLQLRYLPASSTIIKEEYDLKKILKAIIDENNLKSQLIFLFYVRMSPVIKINLTDLLQLNLEEILPEHEDVAVMAIDGSWLIFKSLEGEWVFGRQ